MRFNDQSIDRSANRSIDSSLLESCNYAFQFKDDSMEQSGIDESNQITNLDDIRIIEFKQDNDNKQTIESSLPQSIANSVLDQEPPIQYNQMQT